jgi:glucokinase
VTDFYAAIDLGGTKVSCGLATAAAEFAAETNFDTHSAQGPEAVLTHIAAHLRSLCEKAGATPHSIGMGIPGLVDTERGITRFLPNLATQWRDVHVADILSPEFACPVYLLNDARMATLGEMHYGSEAGARNLVFLTLGTGIGGGVVIDGRLRLGPLGAAGEVGHQTVIADGPMCGCGNRGCLESVASGSALTGEGVRLLRSAMAPHLADLTGGDASGVNPIRMAEAAHLGDVAVAQAIEYAANYLGIGVANLVTILHPEVVVLGGGMSAMGELLFVPVRRAIKERVRMFPADDVRVERSTLAERAGLYGGIALAVAGGVTDLAERGLARQPD